VNWVQGTCVPLFLAFRPGSAEGGSSMVLSVSAAAASCCVLAGCLAVAATSGVRFLQFTTVVTLQLSPRLWRLSLALLNVHACRALIVPPAVAAGPESISGELQLI
jgi:hypothetical protein